MKTDFTISKKYNVIIFLLLCCILVNAQTLPTVTTVTSPTARDLYSVYLSSPMNGVAVGDSVILHFNGSTWSAVSVPVNGRLEGVHFPTPTTGYIVGVDRSGSSKTYVLLTTNGGTSWTNIAADTLAENLHGVFFTNVDTGFAAGEGVVLKTVNGGIFWSYIVNNNFSYRSVFFPRKDTGYAVGDEFTLLSDSGAVADTLTSINPAGQHGVDQAGPILSIYYPSPDTGYSCGWGGQLYRVNSTGAKMTSLKFNSENLYGTYFLNRTSGFVVSSGVFYTSNAATSWDSLSTPTTDTLRSINFPKGAVIGYAVGDAGTIIKIDATVSTTGVSSATASIPVTVYPNPSDGSFTVQYSGTYQLNVLNSVGQQIYSQSATDAFTINLPDAAPGMYYLQVISGLARAVEKIVIK